MEQVLESSETVFIKRMKLGILDKPNLTETWRGKIHDKFRYKNSETYFHQNQLWGGEGKGV